MTLKTSGKENYVSCCAILSRFLLCFLRSSYNTSNPATFYLCIPFSHSLAPLFLYLSIREYPGSKQFLESLPRIQRVRGFFQSSGSPVNYIERKMQTNVHVPWPQSSVGIGKTLEIQRSHRGLVGLPGHATVQFRKQVTIVPRNLLGHEDTGTRLHTVHKTVN